MLRVCAVFKVHGARGLGE